MSNVAERQTARIGARTRSSERRSIRARQGQTRIGASCHAGTAWEAAKRVGVSESTGLAAEKVIHDLARGAVASHEGVCLCSKRPTACVAKAQW
jgi:hypothetical protein